MPKGVLLPTVLVALWGASVAAQETTATVTGTVSDQTGAVLPGVVVVARHAATGATKTVATTDTGRYNVPFLPVGEYEISYSLPGFQPHVARGVSVHVNDRITINARLNVRGEETSVEVSTASALVQATPAVQWLMRPVQVQALPLNNRNFVQLATLVPGVVSSLPDEVGVGLTSSVSIGVAGARRNAVNWLVDGASNVDVGSNITLLSTPTLESIEEFKILTSSYAAEWPRSGGGVVNVVTRSGGNVFRGTAYEFLRNDALDANGFFRKQSADPAIAGHPPQLDYHDFGYTLGGPVRRDRLFFFWSQEWRFIDRAPSDLVATVPDPAWLQDPASPNYVAPELRDANAVRLLVGLPRAQHRQQSVPQLRGEPPEDPPGGPAARLEPERPLAPDGALHPRPQPDDGARRAVLQHAAAGPRGDAHARARPGLRRAAHDDARQPHAQRALAPVLGQRDRERVRAERAQLPRRVRPADPGAVPGEPRRADPAGLDHRPLGDRRQPAVRQLVPEHDARRQPVAAERQPHAEGGDPGGARGEERAVHEPDPGQLRLRRGRRAHGVPELPHRQRGRPLRRGLQLRRARGRGRRAPALAALRGVRAGLLAAAPRAGRRLRPALRRLPRRRRRAGPPDELRAVALRPAAAPAWSGPAATTLVAGSGDFANGIVVAGRGSPYGRRIQRTEADRSSRGSASPGTRATTGRRWFTAASASTTTSRWSGSSSRTPSRTRPS